MCSAGIAWTGPCLHKLILLALAQSYFPAVFPLANLNGQNGFKIDGENNNDYSGYSVSGLGDINGDGHDDLLIGPMIIQETLVKAAAMWCLVGLGR